MFLKSSGNVPCIIYISMHITRLNLGASELRPGCRSFMLLSVRFFSICYVVFLVLVLVLYFFVLCALANYVVIIYDYRDPNPLLG